MATLREYFDNDFSIGRNFKLSKPVQIKFSDGSEVEVQSNIHWNFESNSKFLSCYIPSYQYPASVGEAILIELEKFLSASNDVLVAVGGVWERQRNTKELQFSRIVYLYSESIILASDFHILEQQAKARGVTLIYRGPEYANLKSEHEKPVAFISHDTRDKDEVARPLATKLNELLIAPIWYDEFSINAGDSLRESIEKGLKESRHCILVLSKNFLSNKGWTKVEFNSIFTREILEAKYLILPIWHDVTKREVYEYSPSLADRAGIPWSLGVDIVVKRLMKSILLSEASL